MLPKVSLSSPSCKVHTAADQRSVALSLGVRNPHQHRLCSDLANITQAEALLLPWCLLQSRGPGVHLVFVPDFHIVGCYCVTLY